MSYIFADLFSGCGGLSYGFHDRRKFKMLLAVDAWKSAQEIYSKNFPGISFECYDLSMQKNQRSVVARLKNRCDLLLGGPPCQGFSTLGKRRDNDARSTLVDVFADIAMKISPKLIILENVRGITSKRHPKGAAYSQVLIQALSRHYCVDARVVDCREFGLAQTRVRWILVAVRRNLQDAGELVDEFWKLFNSKRNRPNLTLRDAIGDLPQIQSGEGANEIIIRRGGRTRTIFNHKAMNHSAELLARLAHVPPGGGLLDVPLQLLNTHLKKMRKGHYGNGGHVKNIYGRLEWNKPAGTVVAGIDKITCGRFVHPEIDRLLTPRECARLQSFPDTFTFTGSAVTQYYLIGNAVPPNISLALAFASEHILQKAKKLESKRRWIRTETANELRV